MSRSSALPKCFEHRLEDVGKGLGIQSGARRCEVPVDGKVETFRHCFITEMLGDRQEGKPGGACGPPDRVVRPRRIHQLRIYVESESALRLSLTESLIPVRRSVR